MGFGTVKVAVQKGAFQPGLILRLGQNKRRGRDERGSCDHKCQTGCGHERGPKVRKGEACHQKHADRYRVSPSRPC